MEDILTNNTNSKNLEPKSDIEYIYILDMMWEKNPHKEIYLKKKRNIVINVKQLGVSEYSFNLKDDLTKKTYYCSYGWVFVENTEENVKLLDQIDLEQKILEQQSFKVVCLRNQLKRLYIE